MGDSDDDMDYKRRDKFRSERRGFDGGHSPDVGGGLGSRREWRDARPGPPPPQWGRRGYEGGRSSRDRYERSPPPKRMRGGADWDDRYGGGGYYGSFRSDEYDRHPRGSVLSRLGNGPPPPSSSTSSTHDDTVQPPMMSFKTFLSTQDDSISDEEAIKKYAEYKMEFKRQQLNEFFVTHKDEEWFKLKYHPEESVKRREELKSALAKRVQVFKELWDQQVFGDVTVDGDQNDKLIRILDTVVIKLEGGTEEDLKVLDMDDESLENEKKDESQDGGEKKDKEENGEKEKDKMEISDEQLELQKKAKEYLAAKAGEESDPDARSKKRKRSIGDSGNEDEEEMSQEGTEKKKDEDEDENKENSSEESKPRPLHKTASIFLRNLAPTITKQEIEAMCKRYSGFLRAAIADPQPDRRWFRRGWVTFERNVKIKEICYNLNNIRLRDCELGPIVNRDLTRRIRTVTGITVDKKVVRNDIKIAARVISNLDKKWGLWQKYANGDSVATEEKHKDDKTKTTEEEPIGLGSDNPVLDNITDYLIEEMSAEEEELLGKNKGDEEEGEEGEEGNNIARDDELIKVLDRMLFYLRIVHSVDFYNHSEYPNEDEMPNRCGIMHARSQPPSGKVSASEIEEYCTNFEKKMGSFLQPKSLLNDEEALKLGMKNEEDEVEKFIQVNTQELAKDKWLCPLSGKKFKGPEFVRKHIFNKHSEKIEEVKKEVQYYNNYLKDPKRPQLPENPQNKAGGTSRAGREVGHPSRAQEGRFGYGGYREATSYPVYDERRDRYHDPRGGFPDRGGMRSRGGFGRPPRVRDRIGPHPALRVTQNEVDPRGVIDYSDVDLNLDVDYF